MMKISDSESAVLEAYVRSSMLTTAVAVVGISGQADMFARYHNQLSDTEELHYGQQTMHRMTLLCSLFLYLFL